ncbi:MAG: lipopolysaccharide biosynthesis protein [Lachnospiraceae bacterium]
MGLSTLFVSVLGILNLAELGLGSAMVFYMYRAIVNSNTDTMGALFKYYRKCYFIIGSIILGTGIILSPFLEFLVEGNIPEDINIYILYYLNLIGTVSSYYLFPYRGFVLTAYQRNDILSKINSVLIILQNVLQIVVLIFSRNYYLYTIIMVFIQPVRSIVVAAVSKKVYPGYFEKGEISSELRSDIKKKVSALVIYKFGNVIANFADTIVISAFLGLTVLGYYNNYYYIITMLIAALGIYYNSLSAGIGNSIVSESVEKNYSDFNRLVFIQGWIIGWSSICLLCLYQPFIAVWVGETYQLPLNIVISLVIYFYCWKLQDITYLYREAAGLWQYDKYSVACGAVLNLILNVILVQMIGLYGVILSTIMNCVLVSLPWSTRALFKYYFNKKAMEYYKKLGIYTTVFVLNAVCTYFICGKVQGSNIQVFIIRIIICVIVPNVFFWLVYRGTPAYKDVKGFVTDRLCKMRKAS